MDISEWLFVLVVGLACLAVGYFAAPEYISLEEMETDSYEAQLTAKDDRFNTREAEWQTWSKDTNSFFAKKCTLEKNEQRNRLAERNSELMEINTGWQEAFIDLNKVVADFNRVLHDFNINDLNYNR